MTGLLVCLSGQLHPTMAYCPSFFKPKDTVTEQKWRREHNDSKEVQTKEKKTLKPEAAKCAKLPNMLAAVSNEIC